MEINRMTRTHALAYTPPDNWIHYDPVKIAPQLTGAKAAILSLTMIPYQRSWADELQFIQLKREVAGTSRIEGADFTDRELDAAMKSSDEELFTRSQRQASAVLRAYQWIAERPKDYTIKEQDILHVHRLIIVGADDDHCPPGQLRALDQNVTFGKPRHRGAEGGVECSRAFKELCRAINQEMSEHDLIVQALALHYHLAAMHPFLDGNGRTARAFEALLLQKTGLRDTLFIAMSNYYYEEKHGYLRALAEVRANGHDLTSFLQFGLKGVELQCRRLFVEIKKHIEKALYRNLMFDLFTRLKTARKRVIAGRQLEILKLLLREEKILIGKLYALMSKHYDNLKNPVKAYVRDLSGLFYLDAIGISPPPDREIYINLEWPMTITETEFFRRLEDMPRAKTHPFLGKAE